MNRERLRLLAKAIRASTTFSQRRWTHSCGAPACIAGHAAAVTLADGEHLSSMGRIRDAEHVAVGNVRGRAQEWLGLTDGQAVTLFDPFADRWPKNFSNLYHEANSIADRAHVAADLLEALASGEVELYE